MLTAEEGVQQDELLGSLLLALGIMKLTEKSKFRFGLQFLDDQILAGDVK